MILGIDQGTTGTTVILFDKKGQLVSKAYNEFTQYFPKAAWVEHDPIEIISITEKTILHALEKANANFDDVVAIGITNQRETTVIWDRKTGKPVYNAIVWQCRRSSEYCKSLKDEGLEDFFRERTGLVIDAYFSASKIKWILDSNTEIRERAENGELCFGTIDTWLIWNFSKGKYHVTDHTNASRTMIYNINDFKWDEECLEKFSIPMAILPEVIDSVNDFVHTDATTFFKREIPISGIAGDQQAALFGQQCIKSGMIKNTYGTGCFMLMYLGKKKVFSKNGLLTTICCDVDGKVAYALEGSVFVGGAVIQWLRDQLNILENAADSEAIAKSIDSSDGVYFVPAFVGLGAPHWDMDARGIISGLTRGSNKSHIVRAALESIALQSMDVFKLMESEAGLEITEVRVDGGASSNDFLMQLQSDLMQVIVSRPHLKETTVFGAALLAGLGSSFWNKDDIQSIRKVEKEFTAQNNLEDSFLYGWRDAVKKVLEN